MRASLGWDGVLTEAASQIRVPCELVEHGLLDDDDFRDFIFANAVRFWAEVNPDFFKGTAVELEAAQVLAK